MGKIKKGQDLNFYCVINGYNYPVAHAQSCTLTFNADSIETTTKDGLKGRTFDYQGKYTYTLSVTGITNLLDVAYFGTFQLALLQSGKLSFIYTDSEDIQYSGTVLVTQSDFENQNAAMSIFKNTLLGDGEIIPLFYDVPVTPPGSSVDIIDQFGDVLAIVPAPGSYSVLRFDTIDLHSFNPITGEEIEPDIIITQFT